MGRTSSPRPRPSGAPVQGRSYSVSRPRGLPLKAQPESTARRAPYFRPISSWGARRCAGRCDMARETLRSAQAAPAAARSMPRAAGCLPSGRSSSWGRQAVLACGAMVPVQLSPTPRLGCRQPVTSALSLEEPPRSWVPSCQRGPTSAVFIGRVLAPSPDAVGADSRRAGTFDGPRTSRIAPSDESKDAVKPSRGIRSRRARARSRGHRKILRDVMRNAAIPDLATVSPPPRRRPVKKPCFAQLQTPRV